MKFTSFIASTMLIVLIGQHSIMGAPTAGKATGRLCSEGYKMVNGQCISVNSMTSDTETEHFSNPTETITDYAERPVTQYTVLRAGGCSKGMKHGKHGLCEPIQSFTDTEVIKQSRAAQNLPETVTMVLNTEKPVTYETKRYGSCPKGMTHGEHGICEPLELSATTKETDALVTAPNSPETVTMILNEQKPVLNEQRKDGACPEGMKHGEHGICEPIESSSTTGPTDKSTTDPNENAVGGVDIPQGCPNGTQPDEQGSCQPIQPTNSTKLSTDPKNLLKKDGSCPDNYKMIGSQCLYIKPETNSTVYLGASTADDITGSMRPKSGNDGSSNVELVPVLIDNSCPEGTVYSSFGLCQKRSRPTNANLRMKSDGSCPDGFELVNGKCAYKNSKIPSQAGLPKKTNQITKLPQETSHSEESFESTTAPGKQ